MEALAKADITEERDKVLADCILRVRKENRDEELKGLMSRLREAQASKNDAEMAVLTVKISKLHKEKVA
jgi:hypothetical protein